MMTSNNLIVLAATALTLWRFSRVWQKVRSGAIIAPPLVAANFVFALCIIGIISFSVSPLHLLWLFPLSFVLGVVLLFFQFGQKLILGFLNVLAIGLDG